MNNFKGGIMLYKKELENLKAYVPGKPIEAVKEEFGLDRIIKLASNENPLGPSPKAVEAIKNEADKVNIYPDTNATALKNTIVSLHEGISDDQIILGNGGEEIIKLLGMTLINPGDEAIMADPSFALYEIAIAHMGGKPVKIPLTDDYKHDFDKFIEKINDKTKMIFVCNPNNPTGNIMSQEEVEYLVENVPEDIFIVLDEAYFDYAKINDAYPNGLEILKKRKNTIVLRTLSKVAGIAGVRIGYAFSNAELVTQVSKAKGVFNVNRIAQAAAVAAFNDPEHVENTVKLNYESLDLLKEYFDAHEMPYAEPNANFIFVNVKMDSKMLFDRLQRKGIIIRPGFLWDYQEYIRVSTGTIEQTEAFIEALDEIYQELH